MRASAKEYTRRLFYELSELYGLHDLTAGSSC